MSRDLFLQHVQKQRDQKGKVAPSSTNHSERAHSKFSASGSERWFNCPGSVALSEGLPDKSSPWAEEGTQAHEVLEALLRIELSGNDGGTIADYEEVFRNKPKEMFSYGAEAVKYITDLYYKTQGAEISVEERVYLDFLHAEAFGTYDSRIVEYFGTLHVFDYKYGAGHAVSPVKNLQMLFYAVALAHKYQWNFKKVRMWIIQPRIKGYDGPTFWEISILELLEYVPKFKAAIERVEENPDLYIEWTADSGVKDDWCHWCKAKTICPVKTAQRHDKASLIFKRNPIKGATHGKEEKASKKGYEEKSQKESRVQGRQQKESFIEEDFF